MDEEARIEADVREFAPCHDFSYHATGKIAPSKDHAMNDVFHRSLPVSLAQAGVCLSYTHHDDCQQPESHSKVIHYFGTARDVTEHKTFEAANEVMFPIDYQRNYQQDHPCKSTPNAARQVLCFHREDNTERNATF